MRVTQNSAIYPYQRNLEDIQTRKFKEEIRLTTGKNIVSISDMPKETINVKQLTAMIDMNNQYFNNIEYALNEIYVASEQLDAISNKFATLRQTAIDATQIGNTSNLATLAVTVKGLLEDIVNSSNLEFNGQFVFAGTKTTTNSIIPNPPEQNNLPFEIIKDTPTSDNPSGLRVVFKGNNKDRIINKDIRSQEVINTKAEDMFGAAGTEVFSSIIKLYNLLNYKSDGTVRSQGDGLTGSEVDLINIYQKDIAVATENINIANGRNGIKIQRLTAIKEQMTEEITRLKEFRSIDEDTNFAQSTIKLSQEQNALNYSLQVGSRLIRQSLLDFLT